MNDFANWLFKKISRKILSLPKSIVPNLVLPFKEMIKENPIISLLVVFIGVLLSSWISLLVLKITGKESTLPMIVFIIGSLFSVFSYIYLLIDVQYDKYQLEKKKMWDTIKGDDEYDKRPAVRYSNPTGITGTTGTVGLNGLVGLYDQTNIKQKTYRLKNNG
jgi:hypothetical protein